MMKINIIFPNQLFKDSELLDKNSTHYIIEENMFFNHYNFHKQKIYFHRCSMKNYYDFLVLKGLKVNYINSNDENSDIRKFIDQLNSTEIDKIQCIDPEDNWLEKRLRESSKKKGIDLVLLENPAFINTKKDLDPFFRTDKKKLYQTSFYKAERNRLHILLDGINSPQGGKWTYDDRNREKYPKDKTTPKINFPKKTKNHQEALLYVENNFKNNNGALSDDPLYPTDFETAENWFNDFLKTRFKEFGPYEDAILKEKSIINHSILSPLINSGLLYPKIIVNKTLEYYKKNNIPINSCEGFIRQIIGWREFIRGVYRCKGTEERTKNFWGFNRKIPESFYSGTTGIEPLDDTIHKINKSGYANHIERLMIVGNFMLLCEFDPDEVHRWFMELVIDSYDWVMVPNVYGMSQFADGGLMSSKPYISSSNYIIKMSNYKKGEWCKIWDGLFWNFMDKQRAFFLKNPRMRMLISSFDKMDSSKKETHLVTADNFLNSL